MGALTAEREVGDRRSGPGPVAAAEARVVRLPAGRPRVVAPGRRERAYQAQIAELEGALEVSALVERGTQRRCERTEGRLAQSEQQLERSRQVERRLCAILGTLESENARLRERVGRLGAPRRRTWLAALFGR